MSIDLGFPPTASLRHRPSRTRIAGVVFCALVVSLRLSGAAQTVTATTGAVNGIVTDSSKARDSRRDGQPVGAVVDGHPQPRSPTRAGAYRFSAVPPGDHTLTFELAGFGTIVRDGIHVGLGFTATVNAEMSPGAVSRSASPSAARRSSISSSTAGDDAFRQREARQPARCPRHLHGAGEHAGRRDVEDGRGWQPCPRRCRSTPRTASRRPPA